jgi:hypothetical protein
MRLYQRSDIKSRYFSICYGDSQFERHPEEAQNLLFECLNPDPTLRTTIDKVMENKWIKNAPTELDYELLNEIREIRQLQAHPKCPDHF